MGGAGEAGDGIDPYGEALGVFVILGQALNMMFQGVDTSCGNDPCLAHSPTNELSHAHRSVDE